MSHTHYQSVDAGNQYQAFNAPNAERGKGRKCMIISAIVGLVVVIGLGVGIGVGVTRAKNNNNSSSSSASSSNGPAQTNPNDPSTFVKDPNLKQSFYGLAYTPEGSQLPECGANLENVIKDVQLLAQLTSRVRLYGADCNQTALVLEAIKQTKTNITVFLGNYPVPDDNGAAYNRQKDILKEAIETYGTDHIGGVTVGNEFILNYLNSQSATDANGPVGAEGARILNQFISDTRTMLSQMNLPKTIPVGNSDAGSFFNRDTLANVDYALSNVHAWFANVSAEQAATWTYSFFDENNLQVAAQLPNNPKFYIAETGWPTKSSDAGNANNGASEASVANLQIFLDSFVCQANNNGTGYFFFEFFDEKWKDDRFGGVEGWWGLFNADRTLKNVKLPDCPAP